MEQSQLVELIKTLSPNEKDDVRTFANLPFFNNGRKKSYVIALLDFCLNQPWETPGFQLDKKQVFKAVFGGQPLAEGILGKVMVDAQNVVRSYLMAHRYFREENSFQQGLDLAEELRLRSLDNRYHHQIEKLRKQQEEFPFRNVTYFFNQFQFETNIHYVESIYNQKRGDLNIPNVLHTTETYYQIRRVALLTRYLLQLIVTKLEIPKFIQEHLGSIEVPERCLLASPQLEVNLKIFKVLKKGFPTLAEIDELIELLKQHEARLDREELQEFYAHLRNFAVLFAMQDRQNDSICYRLHEIYIDNLERGYLFYEGKLTPSRYIAIIDNALRIQEYDWSLNFIETYKNHFFGEHGAQETYQFAQAQFLFTKGRFDECIRLLPPASSNMDVLLMSKRLELKSLYELGSDLLSYKLDAFKMFLSRTSPKLLSELQRKMNLDFLNLLVQIFVSIPGDQKRSEKLVQKVLEKNQAVDWRWLMAKAKALSGKRSHSS